MGLMAAALALLPLTLLTAFSLPNVLWQPHSIVLHHSALGSPRDDREANAATIDALHAERGFGAFYFGRTYHIGYHYVIRADGIVEAGRPEHCRGAHAKGFNDSLGICILGNFMEREPNAAQMAALTRLCRDLMRRHGILATSLRRHRDCGAATVCPATSFPMHAFGGSCGKRRPASEQFRGLVRPKSGRNLD